MALKASGDDDEEYREMLVEIGRKIDKRCLEDLKYFCRGLKDAGSGKLERIETAQELFKLLEELDEINPEDVDFLKKMLDRVDRLDLCDNVDRYLSARSEPPMAEAVNSNTDPTFNDYSHQEHKIQKAIAQETPAHTAIRSEITTEAKHGSNDATPFIPNHGNRVELQPGQIAHDGRVLDPQLCRGLDFVTRRISRGWQMCARHLDVPEYVIEESEANWPRHIRRQIQETFQYWARYDSRASLPTLIQALRHVRRNDLADHLTSNRF